MKKAERYYVIGYIGSDRTGAGRALADKLGCPFLVLDDEIERLDGRSIKRMCMINGEHEYRNKEFEVLSKLDDASYDMGLAKDEIYPDRLVVACGDGAVLDEMSLEIIKRGSVTFVEEDVAALWERAKIDSTVPYAFMYGDNDEKREKMFRETYEMRLPLYRQAADCACGADGCGTGSTDADERGIRE